MPNRQYEKGRRAEYRVRDVLREQDWDVTRSIGSKGPFDLQASRDGRLVLIEVKTGTGSMSPAARKRLVDLCVRVDAEAVLAYYERGRITWTRLLPGDGRDLWTP